MDELMKQAEDHLAKGRVQIATDEAIHGIKRDDLPEEFARVQWVFRQILRALPEKRDWLDPALEKEMKFYGTAALSSNAAQSAGQEPVAYRRFQKTPKDSGYWVLTVDHPKMDCEALYTHPSSAAQVEEIRNAAENLMQWIETKHRHPVRDEIETGRMVSVRLHALADLYDDLKTAAPSKGEE